MGCDIHGLVERKNEHKGFYWINSGDPDIGRNYTIYAVLANVRNYFSKKPAPFISEPKGLPKDVTHEMEYLSKEWDVDGHSHSWITLKEMKEYNIEQKIYCTRLITSKDKNGNITSTCAGTSGKHLGEVGEISIFDEFPNGRKHWLYLVNYLKDIAKKYKLSDEEVRFVFFFDN